MDSDIYDFEDDDDIDEEDFYLDCHLRADGQCGKVGSEECDWECPYSHGELYAGSKLWNERHDREAPIASCECDECRGLRKQREGS